MPANRGKKVVQVKRTNKEYYELFHNHILSVFNKPITEYHYKLKMLLRSSSAPLLSSVLSSSLNYFNDPNLDKSHSLPSSSFIKRSQSDGNLNKVLSSHYSSYPVFDTSPSFSIYLSNDEEYDDQKFTEERVDVTGRRLCDEFRLKGSDQNLNLVNKSKNVDCKSNALPLFLARGLGIDRIGPGFFNTGNFRSGSGNREESSEIENYYKRMVDENPSNPLILSNYAQFLYQKKRDSERAEEYYSRAILADPDDSEVVSQYAKLVWELYKDKERATSYFDRAVQTTPSNSHVLATYASFLWEANDDDDESQHRYEAATMRNEIMA